MNLYKRLRFIPFFEISENGLFERYFCDLVHKHRRVSRHKVSPLARKLEQLEEQEKREEAGEQIKRRPLGKRNFPPIIDPLRTYTQAVKQRKKGGGDSQHQRNIKLTSLIHECGTLKDLRMLLGERAAQTLDGIHLSSLLLQTMRLSKQGQASLEGGHIPFIMSHTLYRLMPKTLGKMDSNTLSLCASLITELSYQHTEIGKSVMAAIFRELKERVLFLDARGLRRAICAYQRSGYQDEDLMQSLITSACRKMKRFPLFDTGQMLYRLAQGGNYNEQLFNGCLTLVGSKIKPDKFEYHYVDLAFGCSLSRHYDELFLRRTVDTLISNSSIGQINFKNCNDLLSMAGRLNFNDERLIQFLGKKLNFFASGKAIRGLDEVISEGLISCIRFWSILRQHPSQIDELIKLLIKRWNEKQPELVNHKRLDFIYKANVYFEFCHGTEIELPQDLVERAKELQDDYLDKSRHSRPDFERVKEVFMVLRELGFRSIAGFKCPGLPHLLDLSVLHESGRYAMFVNGPRRYTINKPYRKMKDLPLFQQMVESFGWKVVDVPYFEWIELSQNFQRRKYLLKKMELEDWNIANQQMFGQVGN